MSMVTPSLLHPQAFDTQMFTCAASAPFVLFPITST